MAGCRVVAVNERMTPPDDDAVTIRVPFIVQVPVARTVNPELTIKVVAAAILKSVY